MRVLFSLPRSATPLSPSGPIFFRPTFAPRHRPRRGNPLPLFHFSLSHVPVSPRPVCLSFCVGIARNHSICPERFLASETQTRRSILILAPSSISGPCDTLTLLFWTSAAHPFATSFSANKIRHSQKEKCWTLVEYPISNQSDIFHWWSTSTLLEPLWVHRLSLTLAPRGTHEFVV